MPRFEWRAIGVRAFGGLDKYPTSLKGVQGLMFMETGWDGEDV